MPPIAPVSSEVLRALASLPDPYLILAPDAALTVLTATDAFLASTGVTLKALQGKPLLEAFPQAPHPLGTDEEHLHASLQQVIQTGQPQYLPLQRYDLPDHTGTFVERYWDVVNWPVFDEHGQVQYLLHKSLDITSQVQAHAQAEVLQEVRDRQLLQLLYQVPAAVAAVTGPEHRYAFLNARYQALVGSRAAIGECVAEALPELVGQGYIERLDAVYRTGQTYCGREIRLTLKDPNTDTMHALCVDFTYQALRDRKGQITGVLVFAVEVGNPDTASVPFVND